MNKTIRVSFSLFAVFLLLLLPAASFAQEITGSVRGTVQTPSGEPAVGERVTVTDTRTGAARSVATNDRGSFNIRGLTIGGPYTIRVDSDIHRSTVVTDVFTKLSGASTFTIVLEEKGAIEEVIVVSSAVVAGADLALGPSTSFSLAEIEALPTISRQIRDVVTKRQDRPVRRGIVIHERRIARIQVVRVACRIVRENQTVELRIGGGRGIKFIGVKINDDLVTSLG